MNRFFEKGNSIQRENKKIVISNRFQSKKEVSLEWEIQPLTQKENEEVLKACSFDKGNEERMRYETMILVRSILYPDLHDMNLQDSYGVVGSEKLLEAMLTPGEYSFLKEAVQNISS